MYCKIISGQSEDGCILRDSAQFQEELFSNDEIQHIDRKYDESKA